jgi:hypothetical protein
VKKDGSNVEFDVYSFVTTAPNCLTVSINNEFKRRSYLYWLSGSPIDAFALIASRLRTCCLPAAAIYKAPRVFAA